MPTSDWRAPARVTATVVAVVVLAALALFLVYETRRVLVWIIIAAIVATALYPVVNWVERRVSRCRRWQATLLVFLVVFAALAGLVVLFLVPLAREGAHVVDRWPDLANDLRQGRGPLGSLLDRFRIRQFAAQHGDELRAFFGGFRFPTVSVVTGALAAVAGTVAVFVLAYLMVLQAPQLIDASLAQLSRERAERVRRVGADCARTVTGYVTGNLLISVICGVLTYVVLLIMNVPYAGLVALFVAVADLIPLVGATLGAVVAILVAFTQSLAAGIVVVVFFVVYQQVENHLLQPVILSRIVQLNPLTVLLSILIAAELAGIVGALLAIPVAGMIKVIVRDLRDRDQTPRAAGEPPPV